MNNNKENVNAKSDLTNSFQRLTTQSSTSMAPPPGYAKNKSEETKSSPPGFSNNNVNSLARSNGESFHDVTFNGYTYLKPPNASKRNQVIIE